MCGFPQTVHGGLTAAIVDETLGGLCVSLWRSGALGFRPPAYTARLEVDYKKKIPAGSIILCTTELEKVEDRKVGGTSRTVVIQLSLTNLLPSNLFCLFTAAQMWMTARVTNGSGVVYATARALFVAPRLRNVLLGWIPGFGSKS